MSVASISAGRQFVTVMLLVVIRLTHAMSDEIDHIEARYILRLKEINRLAFLLREDGDQHIGSSDLSFARALHVEYRSLQNALETQSRLCINLCFA